MLKVKSFVLVAVAVALLVALVGSAFAVAGRIDAKVKQRNSKTTTQNFIKQMEKRHESIFGKGTFEKMKTQMESMMGKDSFEKMTKAMSNGSSCGQSSKQGKNNSGMMQGTSGSSMMGI